MNLAPCAGGRPIRFAAHKRTAAGGGGPAYEHIVRSAIHNLQEAGYLARVGRGRYCLTDTGKTRAVI